MVNWTRSSGLVGVAVLALLGSAAPGASQEAVGVAAQQVADLEAMKDKFVSLARAFDDGHMEWRPMEGVRSVKDVIDLMVAEVHLFPAMWGFTPPSQAREGFMAEMNRVAELSPDAAIAELETGFDFMIESVRSLSSERLHEPSDWFGTTFTLEAAIAQAIGDMHEHLGQFIAYARSNEVVPPWSAGG
jgi:hypothetical protein